MARAALALWPGLMLLGACGPPVTENSTPHARATDAPTVSSRGIPALRPTPEVAVIGTRAPDSAVLDSRSVTSTLPTPTSLPLASAPTARPATVAERVRQAVTGLRSGELEATSTYPDGTRSSVRMQFNLGDVRGPSRALPALYRRVTYNSSDGSRSFERITIGEMSWQRDEEGAAWQPVQEDEGVYGQLQPFLPPLPQRIDPELQADAPEKELHWFDRARNRDTKLLLAETGVPERFQQTSRSDGSELVVDYRGWNTPVSIQRPS